MQDVHTGPWFIFHVPGGLGQLWCSGFKSLLDLPVLYGPDPELRMGFLCLNVSEQQDDVFLLHLYFGFWMQYYGI